MMKEPRFTTVSAYFLLSSFEPCCSFLAAGETGKEELLNTLYESGEAELLFSYPQILQSFKSTVLEKRSNMFPAEASCGYLLTVANV